MRIALWTRPDSSLEPKNSVNPVHAAWACHQTCLVSCWPGHPAIPFAREPEPIANAGCEEFWKYVQRVDGITSQVPRQLTDTYAAA